MQSTSILFNILTMIPNFTIFFIFKTFMFNFSLANITGFCISYDSCCTFANNFISFFKYKLFSLRIHKTFSCNFYLYIHHAYFLCCRWICCRWIFRIIFTSINVFYYTFNTCINNKWYFIIFLILTKF